MKKKLIAVNKLCLGVPEGEVCTFMHKILYRPFINVSSTSLKFLVSYLVTVVH